MTVLFYLNDVTMGGHTFFWSSSWTCGQNVDGFDILSSYSGWMLDKNALYAAKPAIDVKYVSQVWTSSF